MKIGLKNILDAKRGTTQISKIMRGTVLIWEKVADFYNLFKQRVLSDGGTFIENPIVFNNESLLLTPNAFKAGKLYSALHEDGTGYFTVDRNSTATYTGQDGLIKTAQPNFPRIDWSTGEAALLVEQQSTNLIRNSEYFPDSAWRSFGDVAPVISISSVISPDGVNFAYNISGNPDNFIIDKYNTARILNHARSIWARTVSGVGQLHLLSYNGNSNNLFNLTEQWQRFEVLDYIDTGSDNFYLIDFRGSSNITEVLLWGAQAEEASTASSYIPANGTTVTRLADNISVPTPAGVNSITETIDGIEQTPITTIPATYSLPVGNINKITMQ